MSAAATTLAPATCTVCGTDRVTRRGGILVDVAVYPTARYARGPHARTCTGAVVAPVAVEVRPADVLQYEAFLALVADGVEIPAAVLDAARVAAGR